MDAAPSVFDPPVDSWRRLSPKLVTLKRLSSGITLGIVGLVVAVPLAIFLRLWWPPAIAAGVVLVWYAWLYWRAPRVVRAWGWAERDGDLCIRHGLMWKTLTVVPFARMQLVKVTSGPLERAFGLSSVELVTASAATAATIPGLTRDEAVALRDRLIESSDAVGSGI